MSEQGKVDNGGILLIEDQIKKFVYYFSDSTSQFLKSKVHQNVLQLLSPGVDEMRSNLNNFIVNFGNQIFKNNKLREEELRRKEEELKQKEEEWGNEKLRTREQIAANDNDEEEIITTKKRKESKSSKVKNQEVAHNTQLLNDARAWYENLGYTIESINNNQVWKNNIFSGNQILLDQYVDVRNSIGGVNNLITSSIKKLEAAREYFSGKYEESKHNINQNVMSGGPDAANIFMNLLKRHQNISGSPFIQVLDSARCTPDFVGEFLGYLFDKSQYLLNKYAPTPLMATIGAAGSIAADGARKSVSALSPYIVELIGQQNVDKTLELMTSTAEKIKTFTDHLHPGEKKLAELTAVFFGAKYATKAVEFGGKGISKIATKTLNIAKDPKKAAIASWDIFDEFLFYKKKDFTELLDHVKTDSVLHKWREIPLLVKQSPVLFEKYISIIEEAIAKEINIKDIPKQVVSDCGELIKNNKQGIVIGFEHMQNHHIFMKNSQHKWMKNNIYKLIEKAGISINDPANTVLLPDEIGKAFYGLKRTLHSGKHDKGYCKRIDEGVTKIIDEANSGNWEQKDYSKKVLKLLDKEKFKLIRGKTKLNNAQPLDVKINKNKKRSLSM